MALARSVAEGNWLRSLFAEVMHHDYVLENGMAIRERMAMMLVVDNKPIYDHAHGEGVVVKDKRLAIDMLVVRRDLKEISKHKFCAGLTLGKC